jgi:hypothetical protein
MGVGMRNIFFIFLGLSVLAAGSLTARAAESAIEGQALAKTFAHATQWKDLWKEIHGWLPESVVKEFETAAAGEEVPDIRYDKGRLLVADGGGTHIRVTFGRAGTIFLNGKEWKLKPLASVKGEVQRLGGEKPSPGEAGFLDLLLPNAYASTASPATALVLAEAAARWKAVACRGDNLSPELTRECVLMAVAIKQRPIAELLGERKNQRAEK